MMVAWWQSKAAFRVSIPYLREMFSADGEDIVVELANCTRLSMKIWEEDVTTDDLKRIVDTNASILSTESDDVPVHVFTSLGELDIDFDELSLSLDNGRRITFEELCEACESYWDRWEKEAKSSPGAPG